MMHDITPATVGTVEFTNIGEEFLAEMSPGNVSFNNIGFCSIDVFPNEGPKPHFHIRSKSKRWECCIEIYQAKYFSHGSKQGTLNNKQLKLLNDWLQLPNPTFDGMSNWKVICAFWKAQGNPMTNVPKIDTPQPDYTKTK